MKLHLLTFLLLFLFFVPSGTEASGKLKSNSETTVTPKSNKQRKASYQYQKQNLEHQLGRKLKWSEKLGLRALGMLPDKDEARKANNHAMTGFILGIASLVLLPLLSIPGFIFSRSAITKEMLNPGILEGSNKGLAKAGQILSIIGFVYLLLFIFYIIIVVSSGLFFM